jgi:hypothetical protein
MLPLSWPNVLKLEEFKERLHGVRLFRLLRNVR